MVMDDLRKEFDTAYLGAVINRSMGGEAEIPTWQDIRAEFEEYLSSEPEYVDVGQNLHMMALGLR